MQFFLYEIVARIVAIYLFFDCSRKLWYGLKERKIAYFNSDPRVPPPCRDLTARQSGTKYFLGLTIPSRSNSRAELEISLPRQVSGSGLACAAPLVLAFTRVSSLTVCTRSQIERRTDKRDHTNKVRRTNFHRWNFAPRLHFFDDLICVIALMNSDHRGAKAGQISRNAQFGVFQLR